jgi:hypothetical protein
MIKSIIDMCGICFEEKCVCHYDIAQSKYQLSNNCFCLKCSTIKELGIQKFESGESLINTQEVK